MAPGDFFCKMANFSRCVNKYKMQTRCYGLKQIRFAKSVLILDCQAVCKSRENYGFLGLLIIPVWSESFFFFGQTESSYNKIC